MEINKKIKVLRMIAMLNIGGPTINAVLLTGGLDKERFESMLVVGRISESEGDMSYFARDRNIEPVVIPQLRREIDPIADVIAFYKIYKLILKFQPDIIHTHTAKAGTLGRAAAILFNLLHRKKIKLVHTFHGHVLSGYFNKFFTYIFLGIEKILAKFTDRIIAISETLKSNILSLQIGNSDKIKVVHLGFELDKFYDIPLRVDNDLTIGIVGRLVSIKNHRMLLDVIRLMLDKQMLQAGQRFSIIGDGELKDELKRYVDKLGIADKVNFFGWQNDLVKVYRDIDIVALTSINEGTPVSLIEALASSRPVIATDVGGVRDIIGEKLYPEISDRGILVKSNDINGFADGLSLLLKNRQLRHSLGASGRQFVQSEFNNKRLIKNTEMVYNAVLNCRS
ncbi:MAG TPA: glycosyltransferase family 1 protein [Candidatus Omnitrophica bacterium]|nr:glycosyltransferase family 1 protein [Candidatus Omnitrophota bacterium]